MSRPFADVLRDLAGGTTYETLTLELGEVVNAVIATRKAGELTLKLKIAPNGEASVRITDEVKTKMPEDTRGFTLFFATGSGSLVRNDPRQSELGLIRQAPEPSATIKDITNV